LSLDQRPVGRFDDDAARLERRPLVLADEGHGDPFGAGFRCCDHILEDVRFPLQVPDRAGDRRDRLHRGDCAPAIQAAVRLDRQAQFPESSLAADVARLRQVLDRQDGPAIVAGHSYGGQIMTALGTDAPNVAGLVYIAAFGLDEGESIGGLLAQGGPPTPALAHLDIDKQGFAWLPEDDFVQHFAADIDPAQARVMHAVQQPLSASTFQDVMGVPTWKSHPSWYLVAENDEAIPLDAERQFAKRMGATTIEVQTGHVAMVSHPDEVAQLIKTAAEAVQAAS
jgi:pimeloyl-ACP methyl ester carboxylesterase